MEIFGGFMVMMSILTLFLAVVWLIMPFVVFAIKGKQERTLEVMETMEKRLTDIEARLQSMESRNFASKSILNPSPVVENVAHLEPFENKSDLGVSPVVV